MKKTLSLILALMMMLSIAACSNGGDKPAASNYEGTLSDLANAIYEKEPVELMMGEPMDIDVSDKDVAAYYLGVTDASVIKEAVFTEPMTGSQAYSLCLARLNDGADAEAVKKDMAENVDTRKWICVEANQVRVVSHGDVVMMLMLDSQLADGDKLVAAFETITGGLTGETQKQG